MDDFTRELIMDDEAADERSAIAAEYIRRAEGENEYPLTRRELEEIYGLI